MPALKKLINKLNSSNIKYIPKEHRKVYTTFDAAQTQKINLSSLAKTLLIKADKEFVFAVIPGNRMLEIQKLKKLVNKYLEQDGENKAKNLSIANEMQIKRNITKNIGALPPFGSIYGCRTYVDKLLLRNKKINLNAGSFTNSLEITPAQYKKFEKPIEGNISKAKR